MYTLKDKQQAVEFANVHSDPRTEYRAAWRNLRVNAGPFPSPWKPTKRDTRLTPVTIQMTRLATDSKCQRDVDQFDGWKDRVRKGIFERRKDRLTPPVR